MNLWQRWKRTSLPNKLLVIASGLMAFGTLFYGAVAIFQYRMMREQSETTKGQLRAMQEQSSVIQEQLHTMRNQADSMKTQTGVLQRALAAAEIQANASVRQIDISHASALAAEESATIARRSFETGERPILIGTSATLPNIGPNQGYIMPVITIRNIGHSPAIDIALFPRIGLERKGRLEHELSPFKAELLEAGAEVTFKIQAAFSMDEEIFRRLSINDYDIIISGHGRYGSLAGDRSYQMTFCWDYDSRSNKLLPCKRIRGELIMESPNTFSVVPKK